MLGKTLSHYRIVEKLGSGGMGEVYVAADEKLGRRVALKVLPPGMVTDERLRRFEREAKSVAALNHPNIVHVYSVEEAEGVHFITMELVRGKTLAELLPKNGMPLAKFFDIAIPLTDAVSAAHGAGITHRDLKPDNVMVSEDGRVKVLDFGLAKPAPALATERSDLPTATRTQQGTIVGTLAYMSPEQAQGKAVDSRSDIFSLGILYYEMLSGRRPFDGDTPASLLSSVIKDTPRPVTELNPAIPRDLGRIVKRCLAKEPLRRYQSAVDLRNHLEEAKEDVASGEAFEGVSVPPRASKSSWALGGVIAAAALAVVALVLRDSARRKDGVRLANPVQLTTAVGVEDYPTWSPDGRTVAYAATMAGSLLEGNSDIWVTQLGGGEPVNRTPDHVGKDLFPTWSPDGSRIAFWSDREGGGYFVMSSLGGPAQKLVSSATDMGPPRWSADGSQLACMVAEDDTDFLEIVSVESRASERLELPGIRSSNMDLSWSGDGRLFAYADGHIDHDVTTLWVFRAEDATGVQLSDGLTRVWSPVWSREGDVLFFVSDREGTMDLWRRAVRRDGRPEGDPEPVTVGLGIQHVAFSRDGAKLAYSRGRRVANLWRLPVLEDRRASWADAEQLTFDEAFVETVDASPDGARLVLNSDRSGNMDLWVIPSSGGPLTRLTTDPNDDLGPKWSPDGREIVFYSVRTGQREIWVQPVDGGPAEQLTEGEAGVESWWPDFSTDGREIAFNQYGTGTGIYILSREDGSVRQLSPRNSFRNSWSPAGDWLVTSSLQLVSVATGQTRRLVERSGVTPCWSTDGKTIYYAVDGVDLWSVSVDGTSERRLTELRGRRGSIVYQALTTDGRYLYFSWQEDTGDIWVADVVTGE